MLPTIKSNPVFRIFDPRDGVLNTDSGILQSSRLGIVENSRSTLKGERTTYKHAVCWMGDCCVAVLVFLGQKIWQPTGSGTV